MGERQALDINSMQFKSLKIRGGEAVYLGSLDSNKALVFIGRSSTTKSSAPLQELINRLVHENYLLLWPIDRTHSIVTLLTKKSERFDRWLDIIFGPDESFVKDCLRKFAKSTILAFYPSKWDHFYMRERKLSLPSQIDFYRRTLRSVLRDKAVSILSHSAGGRIAAHLCDEPNVERMICFGYPFRHPEKPEESERTDNLRGIQKPFLIIQGVQDEYGGKDVASRYELSPCIEFEFVASDHNYENMSDVEWSAIVDRIESFLNPLH